MYVANEIKYTKIILCCIKHVIWLNIVFSKCNLLLLLPICPLKWVKDASLSAEPCRPNFRHCWWQPSCFCQHQMSLWIKKKPTRCHFFVFFISLLIIAQHVSANHVPIIRSLRLCDVIASCWYVPWLQEGCQDRLAVDVTFCIVYFSSNSCSTCFGQPCAHHQELTTAWYYSLMLVCAVAAGRLSRPVGSRCHFLYCLFPF